MLPMYLPSATLFVFFPAAAWTGIIIPDFAHNSEETPSLIIQNLLLGKRFLNEIHTNMDEA
jgi:hypothetical protein